jgi:zinc transporter, ZIP family
MLEPYVTKSLVAGLLASVACGLGALPLGIKSIRLERRTGLAYGVAGGLMFSASVYNLILPSLNIASGGITLAGVLPVILGILSGAAFLWYADLHLTPERLSQGMWSRLGNRSQALIFIAMSIHSIPEGVAVGVGYASEQVYATKLGSYIALAIAIHNIPEGLAVGIPMRAGGASLARCFWMAFLTSLPQPIAAVPASIVSSLAHPLMPVLMGFAAGAMIYLVLLELIPQALEDVSPPKLAWAFTIGFCGMILVQVLL